MVSFIPAYYQKKLLRYALSYFPVVDTDTLDLDQLDIAWGKRSSVELRDVGLHIKKLSHLLQLPDELLPTKARILSLRITVPAALHNSSIEVEVQGIDVQFRLGKRQGSSTSAKGATPHVHASGKAAWVQTRHNENPDHMPTAQELAESFLKDEPAAGREELAEAIQKAGLALGDEEDDGSEASDEGAAGTGVDVSVPVFLANFLKGIIDRLRMTIFDVKFILDTELATDSEVMTESSVVSLSFMVSSVAIDGFTHDANSDKEGESSGQDSNRRKVRLSNIYGDLITQNALFASLERVSTASSRRVESSAPSSPQISQGKMDTSSPPFSPNSDQQSRRPEASRLEASQSRWSNAHVALISSQVSIIPANRMQSSYHSQDRFADASDDEQSDIADFLHESQLYAPSSLAASGTATSNFDEDLEAGGEFAFMMEDSHSSHGYQSQGLDPFTALESGHEHQQPVSRPSRRDLPYHSVTAPPAPLHPSDSSQLNIRRPIQRSEPATRRGPHHMFQSATSRRDDFSPAPSSPRKSDSSSSPSEEVEAFLAQSVYYSHEESNSMYMSAMGELQSEHYHIPGGWGGNSSSDESIDVTKQKEPHRKPDLPPVTENEPSGTETPRLQSPSNSASSPESRTRGAVSGNADKLNLSNSRGDTVSKRLFSVDEIVLWLPWTTKSEGPEAVAAGDVPMLGSSLQSKGAGPIPGAFSQYQSVFADRFKDDQKTARFGEDADLAESRVLALPDSTLLIPPSDSEVTIEISRVESWLDMSSIRLVYRLVEQIVDLYSTQKSAISMKKPESSAVISIPTIFLKLQQFTLGFMENLPVVSTYLAGSSSSASFADPMFEIVLKSLTFSNVSSGLKLQVKLELQTFSAGYPGDPILSFDKAPKRQSLSKSRRFSGEPDVKVVFKSSPARGPELDVVTVPILLALNLQKLDDSLSIFGGVSGILDLSSSIASNSTILGALPIKSGPGNVRFGGEGVPATVPTLSPIKVNARFYGASLLLKGKTCAVSADTGTLAITIRQDAARVKIEHIQLRAPHEDGTLSASAFTVDVFKTDVRFLVSGEEGDFENLIALIEPSSDRYEDMDTVMTDTLRRQRKNGSVLRIEVADIQANVANIEHVDTLQQLADELGRLSSGVTKYLPEDDRPGILILSQVANVRVYAQINDKLGLLDISGNDMQVAHVGTPLLIGFKLGAISANREDDVVIDTLLPLSGKTATPALMGRYIGNVPESRMKLKIFNILLEYRIPTLLALLGVSEVETVEDLALGMAASIATFKQDSESSDPDIAATVGGQGRKSAKERLHLDVLVRDCAVGLNPAKSTAKGLLLLSQSQWSIDETDKDGLQLHFDLKRATILLVDDTDVLNFDIHPTPRSYDSDIVSPAMDDLTRQGFQPVASIWSAHTTVLIARDDSGETLIDVNLNNKLFTLETCADSQSTLAALLSGLGPPLPRKQEQMYRTHVMPIEDLMESFTGEAFAQTSEAEVGLEPLGESLNMEEADQLLEDIPSNMDFVGSFYDPEEETGAYNPSVLGSVHRLSSLLSSKNENFSFAEIIEEKFEHGADNMLINPDEDYLEVFKFKAPTRRWNSKAARLDPIFTTDTKSFPVKVTARIEQITWNLHDGYDWIATRDKIAQAIEKVEAKIELRRRARRSSASADAAVEEIADHLFQSIWINVPADADERDLRRGINRQIADEYSETGSIRTESVDTKTTGGRPVHRRKQSRALHLERSRKKISFDLQKTVADFLLLPAGAEETQSSIALRVGDFEIYDHVPSSTWKKFLTHLHATGERQMGKPMIRLDAVTVKQVADLAATEVIIKANLLPLRLHVDQAALEFITRFFDFRDERFPASSGTPGPYIARLEVNSIPIALDYKPHKIDYAGLRSGSTSEFANIVILERAEFVLKRLILYGIQSPDVLQPKLKAIWTADVVANQLPTVLAGLSGVRPFVNVGQGIRNLVVIPMNEYKKDGRVVRSIQKGAVAFAKTTTSELARLGAKVAIGTQTVLEGAEGLLSPALENRDRYRVGDDWDVDEFSTSPVKEEVRAVSNYADQPLNVITGLRDAWQGLERDLLTAKDAIIAIGGDVRESGTALSAVGAVARLAPTIILRPAIGATRGVGMALLGAGNMLDKDSRRKIEDKYKRY